MVRFAAYRPVRRRIARPRPQSNVDARPAANAGRWFRWTLLLTPGLGPILFVAIGWATYFRGPGPETKPQAASQPEIGIHDAATAAPDLEGN